MAPGMLVARRRGEALVAFEAGMFPLRCPAKLPAAGLEAPFDATVASGGSRIGFRWLCSGIDRKFRIQAVKGYRGPFRSSPNRQRLNRRNLWPAPIIFPTLRNLHRRPEPIHIQFIIGQLGLQSRTRNDRRFTLTFALDVLFKCHGTVPHMPDLGCKT
jgi:hypothetical protein